ncbi:MAG: hypothetical protein AAF927_14990 [Bacteroidota bacterium]
MKILLTSLMIVWALWTSILPAQDSTYLQRYATPLEVAGTYEGFAAIDTVLPNYRFFFTAEEHWQSINTQIQFAFLSYLHQKAGVRNFIVEGGYSYGFLLNRYLQTGNERLLDKVVNDIPVCPENQLALFKEIYAYNQTLPEEDHIQVTGIDLEHSAELAVQCLHTLLPKKTPHRKIARKIDKLRDLHRSDYFVEREVKSYFRSLNKDIAKREQLYRNYWGEDFPRFQMIVENTLQGFGFDFLRLMLFPQKWQEREERMYKNFLVLQPYMKKGTYYAQFGALHTDIKESFRWEFPSLAHRLNYFDSSPVDGQVLTISRYFRDMKPNYDRLGESDRLHGMMDQIEKKFKNEEIVLLNLMGQETPFPRLSQTFQFIMLLDEDLEEDRCE